MVSDEVSTVERIVAAATEEFSRRGVAGARVDRIASAARTSKERVYAHFRSKTALYRYVVARELDALSIAVPIGMAGVADYTTRLFDHAMTHPDQHRLLAWGQLEDLPVEPGDPITKSLESKVAAIRDAQRNGVIPTEFSPEDVLMLATQLATAWVNRSASLPESSDRAAYREACRRTVVAAVERLFPEY